jgi:hypothetical protein
MGKVLEKERVVQEKGKWMVLVEVKEGDGQVEGWRQCQKSKDQICCQTGE